LPERSGLFGSAIEALGWNHCGQQSIIPSKAFLVGR
jgi:hypothetical protein